MYVVCISPGFDFWMCPLLNSSAIYCFMHSWPFSFWAQGIENEIAQGLIRPTENTTPKHSDPMHLFIYFWYIREYVGWPCGSPVVFV
jgi:hypothetical protein